MVQVRRPATVLEKLVVHLKENYRPRNVEVGQSHDQIMFEAGERTLAQKVLSFIANLEDSALEEEED